MSQQTINTVIVLRNDQTTAWEKSTYKLLKGEVGIGYLENGNVIAKLGDGQTAWKDLPQIEGVLEDEITLTHDFGRYKTDETKGFVKTTDAKDKTISQWLIHALSETKEPVINLPTFALTASAKGSETNFGEIGTYITKLEWDGTTTYGSYEYGPDTGLSAANRTWSISNSVDGQTSKREDGTFTLTSDKQIQLNQEASKTYATVTGTYNLDASGAADPVNNVGATTTGKITSMTDTIVANVDRSAYRKPFWGWKDTANALAEPEKITSAQIRALNKSGTSTGGLPSSVTVPGGTKQVYFAAKAGTKKSLTVKNTTKEPATGVACTKVANAVSVEGANGFTGTNYDLWYINLDAAFTGETKLSLTWA